MRIGDLRPSLEIEMPDLLGHLLSTEWVAAECHRIADTVRRWIVCRARLNEANLLAVSIDETTAIMMAFLVV